MENEMIVEKVYTVKSHPSNMDYNPIFSAKEGMITTFYVSIWCGAPLSHFAD